MRRIHRQLLGLGIGLALVAATAAAGARPGAERVDESTEVLFGSHNCGISVSEQTGFSWLGFEATGDLVPRYTSLNRQFPGVTTADFCNTLGEPLRQVLGAEGCTVGAPESQQDETGYSEDFQFVCHGARSRLIALIAALSERQLTAAP